MATAQQIDAVKKQMADLGQQWHQTNDPTKQKQISDTSLQLGSSIGAKRNESAGTWDYSGVKADPVDYAAQAQTQIGAMMEAERAARLQALRAQQQKATGQLNQQKAEVQPQYYAKKNEADANMAQNVQRLREVMASNGLSGNTAGSGENITANVAQNAARQNVLGDLNLQEQQTLNDFNRRIADVNDPSQEMQIEAALNAEKARMLYDAQNRAQDLQFRDSQFDYQKQRDTSNDTFRNDQFAYQKTRDALGDEFRQKQFDEDNRRFGLTYALQQAGVTGFMQDGTPTFAREQFNADNSYRNSQLAIAASKAAASGAKSSATAQKKASAEATKQAITELGKYDNYEQAANDFSNYFQDMKAAGIDTDAVEKAIQVRFRNTERSWIQDPGAASDLAGQQLYGKDWWKN